MTPSPPTVWWDNDTIERIVTKEFVSNRLVGGEIAQLDETPSGFGENLTDSTYWDWIRVKAKRFFLILTDLDLPDQIFGLIDESWDDDDLPIALDQVERLALTSHKDEKIEKRFYRQQYHYLLQHLKKGQHFDYDDDELVPLDVVDKKHGTSQSFHPHITKVALPLEPGKVFCRCQVPLGPDPGQLTRDQFVEEINGIKPYQNEHLLSYWCSYTHQGHGYVLFTPVPEYSLKTLLTTTPACLKTLDKHARRQTVLDWLHCLADTLCVLYAHGPSSANIKPSTVMFTADHRVLLAGFTHFHARLLRGGDPFPIPASFDKETYDYSAPERCHATLPTSATLAAHSDIHPATAERMLHAADTYALGCVSLELLSFLFKKQGRAFATYRAARHKSPGRGGAVPDASFHRNAGQVEAWAVMLAAEARKKMEEEEGRRGHWNRDGTAVGDGVLLRGVAPLLRIVVTGMLAVQPEERPAAVEVQARMYEVLGEVCEVREPHCVHHYGGSGGGGSGGGGDNVDERGIAGLRQMSPSLAVNGSTASSSAAVAAAAAAGAAAPASMSLPLRWMSGRRASVVVDPRRPSTSGGSTGSEKSGDSGGGQEGRVKANSRGREGKARDKSKK